MKQVRHILKKSSRVILNSIAFYPTLMSILSICFAIFMIYFEYTPTSRSIKEGLEIALVKNAQNARMILGTTISGIISLTVFSFSMVMVMLNRATATTSPRVIPGIISRKFHQIVLGFYLGTIIYSLMLFVNINSIETGIEVPSLGILIAMILAILCLGLFVFFIHSISKSIQVDDLLHKIFHETKKQIQKIHVNTRDVVEKDISAKKWFDIKSERAGYFNEIETISLLKFLRKNDLKLRVNTTKGFFIPEKYPYLSVNKNILDNNKWVQEIKESLVLEYNDHYKEHFNFGFKQITEIAVKALSPGINDPGTANKALDLLNVLFKDRMGIPDYNVEKDDEGKIRIIFEEWKFSELLFRHIGAIREYGKKDIYVMINLLDLIKNLMYADEDQKYSEILIEEAKSIIQDVENNNSNFLDIKACNIAIKKINVISKQKFEYIEA